MSIRITDSPEQAKVIHAPADDDVLVVAGAGSGKTYTMTRRIINLIAEGVPPERILGLTFTRKAASELLTRVSAAISERDELTDRTSATHVRRMFLKPEISTYDAFFQSIVRQYGLLVGFDRETQPLSEAGAITLAASVIGRHTESLLSRDFGSFNTVVDHMLGLSHAIGNAMIGVDISSVDEAIARIRQWDADFIQRLDTAIGEQPVPQEIPKAKAPTRARKDTDASYAVKQDEYRAQLHELCVWRCDRLRDVAQHRDVLLDLVAEYEREKRRQNMAEFSDFTVAAYQLVSRFPSISQTYRRRYSHVLLDEYQDTSTTQAMLIAALFHPSQNTDTVTSVTSAASHSVTALSQHTQHDGVPQHLLARSLKRPVTDSYAHVNAVGDPFQSIYAWRGASPGAFRMFQRDFDMPADAKPYPLSVTRRNSRIVLEAANNLTLPLRLPTSRRSSSLMHEVEVNELSALDTADVGTIGVLGFDTFGQEVDAVARFARQAIRRYRKNNAEADGQDSQKTPETRTSTEDHRTHVAVLMRSKTHMAQFAQGLERAGLTTLVVGRAALLERPEIRDILALLHVVADRTDSASLMRLLATPRFALGADALAALAGLASRLDDQYRYRSLVEAGLVTPKQHDDDAIDAVIDSKIAREQAAIVRAYRDQVPHAIYLADVLLRKDLARLLDADTSIDDRSAAIILRAGRALQEVQAVANHALVEVIETAVRALNLDIDLIVAQSIMHPDASSSSTTPVLARVGIDTLLTLVDTYTKETLEGQSPTLRGFIAWLDSMDRIEEDTAVIPDTPADVVLMTIHQSKGLEWDAVAVVGMAAGSFPSNQSGLHIAVDEQHSGGYSPVSGRWSPPEYQTSVTTWLDDESAVPAPVRVDAGILPRFPHDAHSSSQNATDGLALLDDVEVIDDEIYGDMRGKDIGDGMEDSNPDDWYLTQEEEYGRRLLADERRLAYVALTRARHDVLITYSRYNTENRDPSVLLNKGGRKPVAAKPSVFWSELHDSMGTHADRVTAEGNDEGTVESTVESSAKVSESSLTGESAHDDHDIITLQSAGVSRPDGFFVGDQAYAYEQAVVEQAWRDELDTQVSDGTLSWPATLSHGVMKRICAGMNELEQSTDTTSASDQLPKHADSTNGNNSVNTDSRDSLLARALMLTSDPDLMPQSYDDTELDDHVRRKASQILARGRQSVTALQTRAGQISPRDARIIWRGLIRPIPHVAPPAAEAGTLLHAWAEQFIRAYDEFGGETIGTDIRNLSADNADNSDNIIASAAIPPTRETMLAELAEQENAIRANPSTAKERHVALWKRRLATSPWASRRPAWAERQIAVALPDGTIVNGKLDAVFYGGLDESDTTKQYVIVDWKTGKRPHTSEDITNKLVQLDWYRLLLANVEHVPLDSIDATLYYLSEPNEGTRELHAHAKTEQEILAELSSGIPEQSDDD